ncbi:MAG TPA: hypothetical protein DCW52_04570 [Gammaproteobacteria bacterium]|nr:hypothetical protein [Gammaproteobacteria bacterium]
MADNLTTQQQVDRRASAIRAREYLDMLSLNEGDIPNVYKDTKGKSTIGIGFNLDDSANQKFLKKSGINRNELINGRPLNSQEKYTLYNHSLTQAFTDAQKFDSRFASRPETVKKAIVDMSFNLGLTKLNKFKKMKEALEVDDYSTAADEMVDSDWYKQVNTRGPRTVGLMRSASK